MFSSVEPEDALIRRVADPPTRGFSTRGPSGQEVAVRGEIACITWAGAREQTVYAGGPVSVAFADVRVIVGCWHGDELARVYSVTHRGVLQEVVLRLR